MQVFELPHEKSRKPVGQLSSSVSGVVVVVVVVVVGCLVVGCLRGRGVVLGKAGIHSRRFRRLFCGP